MTSTAGQEKLRTAHGFQCPECFGVNITARQTRFDPSPTGWQCEECGCNWSKPLALAAAKPTGAA